MRAFLDFEASSLAKASYPIEVAWVFEDGRAESHLIRPARAWTDWDPTAEALHGLSRARLEGEGEPHEAVATRLLEGLSEHIVYASAPSWDGKWLSTLLRAAGLPRHAIRLRDTEEAQLDTARAALQGAVGPDQLDRLVEGVIDQARQALRGEPVRHRALPDAEQELRLWREVRRLALCEAQRIAATA